MAPQGGDALLRPAIAPSRLEAVAVQDPGNQRVGANPRQAGHGLDDRGGRLAAVLAPTPARHAQFGMHPARPAEHEMDRAAGAIDLDQDFLEEGPDDPLLQANIRAGVVPDRLEPGRELRERLPRRGRLFWAAGRCVVGDAGLEFVDVLEGPVPPLLELAGHQAVLGIDRIVLALGALRRIAGRFQVPLERRHDLVLSSGCLLVGHDRRLHGCWLHHAEDLAGDGVVHREAPKGETPRLPMIQCAPEARVAKHVVRAAGVPDSERTAHTAGTARVPRAGPRRASARPPRRGGGCSR